MSYQNLYISKPIKIWNWEGIYMRDSTLLKGQTITVILLLISIAIPTINAYNISSLKTVNTDNESPIVYIEYPINNTIFYRYRNITTYGAVSDDIGIVTIGYTHLWFNESNSEYEGIEPTTNYEFEFNIFLQKGRNEITIHAIDASGN